MSAYSAASRTRWLGAVPWNVAPAWAVFHERSEKSGPTDDRLTPSQHYGVLTQREYMELTGNRVVINKSDRDVAKRVLPNDFIIHLRSFQGGIEHSRVSGKVTNAYTVLRPVVGADPEYYRYFLKSDPFISGLSSMTDQLRDGQSISFGKFSTMRLPLPPLPTQRAIANYLDRETAEIDAMAAELDGLEDTLSSRRDAEWESLYRGVSGPEIAVQYLIESIADGPFGSALTSSHYSDSGYRVIRLGNLGINEYRDADKAYIPEMYGKQLDRHSVATGDVVMAGLGDDKMPLGRACVIPETALPAIVKADCYRLRPRTELISSGYLAWALSSPPLREIASLQSRGSTRSRLNTEIAKSLRLRVPDLAVQSKILDEWRSASSAIDSMIADAKELKALLAERRSALITEVVTGRKAVFSSEF